MKRPKTSLQMLSTEFQRFKGSRTHWAKIQIRRAPRKHTISSQPSQQFSESCMQKRLCSTRPVSRPWTGLGLPSSFHLASRTALWKPALQLSIISQTSSLQPKSSTSSTRYLPGSPPQTTHLTLLFLPTDQICPDSQMAPPEQSPSASLPLRIDRQEQTRPRASRRLADQTNNQTSSPGHTHVRYYSQHNTCRNGPPRQHILNVHPPRAKPGPDQRIPPRARNPRPPRRQRIQSHRRHNQPRQCHRPRHPSARRPRRSLLNDNEQ